MNQNLQDIDLNNLTKIPEKEFSEHFNDWLQRDDVARSLQAKLRKDLIENFNKTSLGKRIISGGCNQRLTLSPLLMALHTLVSEFLYAENCHFSLSVFCTEVPYRNILPDFESTRHFRFTETEVVEIVDALCGLNEFSVENKLAISREYIDNPTTSLLFVIIKNIFEKLPIVNQGDSKYSKNSEVPEYKIKIHNRSFNHLNRYISILAAKVKDMVLQFENVSTREQQQQHQHTNHRKTLNMRKRDHLSRSLERISDNLRVMSLSKRKNKRISEIVSAVNALTKQFEKCASEFMKVSQGKGKSAKVESNEKSYVKWIKEVLSSVHGQQFLDRIEAALRKALAKQKKQSETKLNEKLQQQKELLRLKYKQKLLEHLTQLTTKEDVDYAKKLNNNVDSKLNELQAKHEELLLKIHSSSDKNFSKNDFEKAVPPVNIQKEIETQTEKFESNKDVKQKPLVHLQDTKLMLEHQLQEIAKSIADKDKNVDQIIFDAKLRIQELENESNHLDRSFRDYLERQKLTKKSSKETAKCIWNSYNLEKSILERKCAEMRMPKQLGRTWAHIREDEEDEIEDFEEIPKKHENIQVGNIETFRNAFRIAKEKVLSKSIDGNQYPIQRLEPNSIESLNNEQQMIHIPFPEHKIEGMTIQSSNTFFRNELIAATSDILLLSLPTKGLEHNPIERKSSHSQIIFTKQTEASKGCPKGYLKFKQQLFPLSCGEGKTNDKAKMALSEENEAATDVNYFTPTQTDKNGRKAIVLAQSLEKINALFSPLKLSSNSSSSSDSSLSINSSNKDRPMPIPCSTSGILRKATEKETTANGNKILSTEFEKTDEHQQSKAKKVGGEEDQQNLNLLEIKTIDSNLLLSSGQELHSDLDGQNESVEGSGIESMASESIQLSTGKERRRLEGSSGSDFWE